MNNCSAWSNLASPTRSGDDRSLLALDPAHDLRRRRPDRAQRRAATSGEPARHAGRHAGALPLRHAGPDTLPRRRSAHRWHRPSDPHLELRRLGTGGRVQPDGGNGASAARHGGTQLCHRPRLLQERGRPGRGFLRPVPRRDDLHPRRLRRRPRHPGRHPAVAAFARRRRGSRGAGPIRRRSSASPPARPSPFRSSPIAAPTSPCIRPRPSSPQPKRSSGASSSRPCCCWAGCWRATRRSCFPSSGSGAYRCWRGSPGPWRRSPT